ncbi:MAG: DinB family protein [Phycisphaerales bacterium JB065]
MTTTVSSFCATVVPMSTTALNLGQLLCADIPADQFGRRPEGVSCNTPAWVIGHLSLYPERILGFIGREDLVQSDERLNELFKAGSESPDDPDGSYYPSKQELLDRFAERTQAVIEALSTVDPEVLERENPIEGRFREMFPTIGGMVAFLLGGHTMMHLGQISTWRRCMGLGSAM